MCEIATVLGSLEKSIDVELPKDLVLYVRCFRDLKYFTHVDPQHITTTSRYNASFPFLVAFSPQPMTNVLAKWQAKRDIKQAHIASNSFHRLGSPVCLYGRDGKIHAHHVFHQRRRRKVVRERGAAPDRLAQSREVIKKSTTSSPR